MPCGKTKQWSLTFTSQVTAKNYPSGHRHIIHLSGPGTAAQTGIRQLVEIMNNMAAKWHEKWQAVVSKRVHEHKLCSAPELIGTDYDENQSVPPHYSLHPFSPGCWGAGSCCCLRLEHDQDRNLPVFFFFLSPSPLVTFPVLHSSFSSSLPSKGRIVMACIEHAREAGRKRWKGDGAAQ